jgi:hypothetical protein
VGAASFAAVLLADRFLIRAAGTAVVDFISGPNMLGLPVSTAVTGALFIAFLVNWRGQSRSEKEIAIAS